MLVEPLSASFWADVVIDCYFIVDVFFNFRTAFYDSSSKLQTGRCAIAVRVPARVPART